MRVLVVHNRYSSRVPSGENLAVDDETRWLREAGIDVHLDCVSNDDAVHAGTVQRIHQAAASVWSMAAAKRFAEKIETLQPDIVHVHNLFPLLSASVPRAAIRRALPVVWTVHNHRPVCVTGTNFRDGHPCHLCRRGWRAPGIRHSCYAGSAGASVLVTGATSIFRSLARRSITPIAISQAMSCWLTDIAGFPPERVHVKYNGVARPPDSASLPSATCSRTFLFAGHLAAHKGVALLLDGWQRANLPQDVELRIIGDGPLADDVRAAAEADARITWLGHRPPSEMATHLADARAVVMPSIWQEPFGRSAAEALAYGRPVITSGTGGLSEIVDDDSGWITGLEPDALAAAMESVARDDADVSRRSQHAARRFVTHFSPEITTAQLIKIYKDEIDRMA